MSRLLTALGAVVFALGIVLVAAPSVALIPSSSTPTLAASPTPTTTTTASPTARVFPPISPGYRIQIPRLAIDLAIEEGDLERDATLQLTPEGAAFHLPGTGIPGNGWNSYIYAHARRGMFLALWDARVGDEVRILTPDGRVLRYVVSEVHPRVSPDDTTWTTADAPDRLTLQTSTGPAPDDPRFIVVARP